MVADIDETSLQATLRALPENSHRWVPFTGDLSQKEQIDALFEKAKNELGTVDFMVANAGFAYYESFKYEDWGRMQKIFDLNVLSPLYSLQKMKTLNGPKPHYTLITSSAMAKLAIPGYALYGAGKAALDRFLDAYRFESHDSGKVGMIYPIATRTNFFQEAVADSAQKPVVPWPSQTPEQVAKAMIQGIVHEKRHIYPSLFHQVTRFPQQLYEWLLYPYQAFYARELKKWESRFQNRR